MKMTKAQYLKKFKGINNYRGTDRLVLVEVPDPQEQSGRPEIKQYQAGRRSK